MNKTLVYATLAVMLGLVSVLIPTWVFLTGTVSQENISYVRSEAAIPPLFEFPEKNHVETVSPKIFGVFGTSLMAASIVYVLFKRKTPNPLP